MMRSSSSRNVRLGTVIVKKPVTNVATGLFTVKNTYLRVNKTITKYARIPHVLLLLLLTSRCRINSGLSVRIEELNAHIKILSNENLRLRASEISLTLELKREKEKTRKVIGEAESAVRDCFPVHLCRLARMCVIVLLTCDTLLFSGR